VTAIAVARSSHSVDIAQASQSISPGLIDIEGTYELIIPLTTYQDNPAKLDAYLGGEEVVFSRMITSRVRILRFDAPVSASEPFVLSTFAVKEPFQQHPGDGGSPSGALETFEVRLEQGVRGHYCSLEIAGTGESKAGSSDFHEYYVVLGLGFKNEQSIWLGPANTPAEAPGGKNIQFILVKIED
jgi:hypothetical protein